MTSQQVVQGKSDFDELTSGTISKNTFFWGVQFYVAKRLENHLRPYSQSLGRGLT